MLHTASMDLRYWGEAFLYVVHIRNVTYTSALKDRVPDHAWYDRKPDISHLRVFGSLAYVNIPKKLRGGKLEATSKKYRLLGWWAGETKGYRLEDCETGKLITSCDVRFVVKTTHQVILQWLMVEAKLHQETGWMNSPPIFRLQLRPH